MSIKSKVLAGAAALTVVGGMGAFATGTAHAATPSCGSRCIDVFSRAFGTHTTPNFLVDVLRQGDKVGQPIILFRTSNNDPAEDFTIEDRGLVSDYMNAGLVSKTTALHYGGEGCTSYGPQFSGVPGLTAEPNNSTGTNCASYDPDLEAYQIEYSPYGVGSGLCTGTATAASAGTKVVLEPCGVSAKTVWIADYLDGGRGDFDAFIHNYVPLINASQTNFSNPYVLTYPQNGYPTDMPRVQLTTQTLQDTSRGALSNLQLWGYNISVVGENNGGPGGGGPGGPGGGNGGGNAP
jgi:hypothetical protein